MIQGSCVAITCRLPNYELGVLVGIRAVDVPNWPTHLQFPGGKVDLGEDSMEAAFREVKEEIGLLVRDISFVCSLDCVMPTGEPYNLKCYTHHVHGGSDRLMAMIKNKEPLKCSKWYVESVQRLYRGHPANVLPGVYETLCLL